MYRLETLISLTRESGSLQASKLIPFLITIATFALYSWLRRSPGTKYPLPPGPLPLPIIGNIHQMSRSETWKQLVKLHAQYGPILTLKLGSRTIILLQTRAAVRDLLEKKAKFYSSRPRLIMVSEHLTRSLLPVMMPYDENWKELHAVRGLVLSHHVAKAVTVVQQAASRYLAYRLLDQDAGAGTLEDAFCIYSCNSIATLLYGDDIGSMSLSEARQLESSVQKLIQSLNNHNVLLDLFPVLEKVPGLAWLTKSRARPFFTELQSFFDAKLQAALARPAWNMARTLAERLPRHDHDRPDNDRLIFLIGEIYMAGVATTPLALGALATMATMHPTEVGILRAQLDLLVGPDRVPTFADTENLPYLHAFINESLRLKVILPLGIPHAISSSPNDGPQIYKGYHIPNDAFITPFQWAINRDPSVFADPHSFIPQRWLDDANNSNNPLPATSLFGFGKRFCAGQPFAGNALAIALAVLVWGFTFEPLPGFEGGDDDYRFVYVPPFEKMKVRVRSEAHRAIIAREWEGTEKGVQGVLDAIGREVGLV
ncbi:cytochrome P450 [Aspergillus carlsbadensis]|nr:cytochrome P450 [Aspergillus carlsbadensis]